VYVQVGSTSADLQPDERDPEVELVLSENDYTLKMFPYKFKAVRPQPGHSATRALVNTYTKHVLGLGWPAWHVACVCVICAAQGWGGAYAWRMLRIFLHMQPATAAACTVQLVVLTGCCHLLCRVLLLCCCQVYTVTLHGEQLKTDFRVINTDDKPFEFTTALHTYIEVLDVKKAKVRQMN
jgi:hypothetical protein